MRDYVEALSISIGSPERKNEDVDVQPPMTFAFLSWNKPDNPVQKHTFRDIRSSVAHPDDGPIQQPLLEIPTSNQPIDRSVTDLRKHIEACVTVISNIRHELNNVRKYKKPVYLYHELQELEKRLD
jgi:hypothetical protein